jgi:hypothetical protein
MNAIQTTLRLALLVSFVVAFAACSTSSLNTRSGYQDARLESPYAYDHGLGRASSSDSHFLARR